MTEQPPVRDEVVHQSLKACFYYRLKYVFLNIERENLQRGDRGVLNVGIACLILAVLFTFSLISSPFKTIFLCQRRESMRSFVPVSAQRLICTQT